MNLVWELDYRSLFWIFYTVGSLPIWISGIGLLVTFNEYTFKIFSAFSWVSRARFLYTVIFILSFLFHFCLVWSFCTYFWRPYLLRPELWHCPALYDEARAHITWPGCIGQIYRYFEVGTRIFLAIPLSLLGCGLTAEEYTLRHLERRF